LSIKADVKNEKIMKKMKQVLQILKLSLLLLGISILSLIPFKSQAQFTLDLAPGIGFTMNQLVGDIEDSDMSLGFLGSLGVKMGFGGNFYIQVEPGSHVMFLSSEDESVMEIDESGFYQKVTTESKSTMLLGYVDIPILARYSFTTRDRIIPYDPRDRFTVDLYAGPYVAINYAAAYSSYESTTTSYAESNGDVIQDDKQTTSGVPDGFEDPAISTLDYGFMAGIGGSFLLERDRQFSFSLRYKRGFAPMMASINIGDGEISVPTVNLQSFQLVLQYHFNLVR
jgi:hypothetical protein